MAVVRVVDKDGNCFDPMSGMIVPKVEPAEGGASLVMPDNGRGRRPRRAETEYVEPQLA